MTETEASAPIRIPIGRNITYAVRGMPEVANAYGPGYLVPTEISLTYRATEDSQLGRFYAYVKGHWLRDGEEVATNQKLPGQHYYGDPSTWPDWLAEEARLHDPDAPAAAPSVPADADLRDRIAQAVTDLHEQGGVYALDEPEIGRIADAVLPVFPAPADRAAVLREAADAIVADTDRQMWATKPGKHWAADLLRRKADKAQRAEGERRCPRCGESLTSYCADDLVYRTGDERPYCSGECVVAAHRKAQETREGGHFCGNCEGVDPDSCLTNPNRQHYAGPHCTCVDAGPEFAPKPADPYADGICTFGEDEAPGAGCIKPAGHDGAHLVTAGDRDPFDD